MSKLSMAVADLETRPKTEVYDNHTRKDYRLPDNSRLNAYVDNVVRTGMKGIILPGDGTIFKRVIRTERVQTSVLSFLMYAQCRMSEFIELS